MKAHYRYGTKYSRRDKWTPEEDSTLLAAYISGATYKKLMLITNRGYAGVKARLKKLGAKQIKEAAIGSNSINSVSRLHPQLPTILKQGICSISLLNQE